MLSIIRSWSTVSAMTGEVETFDQRLFRDALGQFATGVAVVSARNEQGEPIGMTVSSFNSVSLDPPLILFSVARQALSLTAMTAAHHYAVSVLGGEHRHLSDRFARRGEDKWNGVDAVAGAGDVPLIVGALAHFECARHTHHDGGDHVLFIARVLKFRAREDAPDPLIFYGGSYRSLAQPERSGSTI